MPQPFANPDAARIVAGRDAAPLDADGLHAFAAEARNLGMYDRVHDGRDPHSVMVGSFKADHLTVRERLRLNHVLVSRGLVDAAALLRRACSLGLPLEAIRRMDGFPVLRVAAHYASNR